MEIKIKDVKEFLEENGFDWEDVLRVNNGRTMHFVRKLQYLKDVISIVNLPIEIKKGEELDDKELSIEVRLLDFVVNTKTTDRTFAFKQNLKNEWIKFLTKRYGKDYIDEINYMVKVKNLYNGHSLTKQSQELGFGC